MSAPKYRPSYVSSLPPSSACPSCGLYKVRLMMVCVRACAVCCVCVCVLCFIYTRPIYINKLMHAKYVPFLCFVDDASFGDRWGNASWRFLWQTTSSSSVPITVHLLQTQFPEVSCLHHSNLIPLTRTWFYKLLWQDLIHCVIIMFDIRHSWNRFWDRSERLFGTSLY